MQEARTHARREVWTGRWQGSQNVLWGPCPPLDYGAGASCAGFGSWIVLEKAPVREGASADTLRSRSFFAGDGH